MKAMRAEAQTFLHAALGFWAGIYAFRTFVPAAVWNLSDALPLYAKGAIAISVHLIGVLGCVLPFLRRPRATFALACAVAAIGVLRQVFLGSDVVGSAASLLGWICWVWWFVAFADYLATRRLLHVLVPGFAVGFALQLGMQSAWHGLDLGMVRGALAVFCALALHAGFAVTGWGRLPETSDEPRVQGTALLLVIGPALFLELTLFGSVGRFGVISGLAPLPSVLLLQAALAVGLALMRFADRRVFFIVALVVLVASALAAPRLHGAAALLILLGQAALIPLLAASTRRDALRLRSTLALGSVLQFALVFLFYNRYEAPALWTLAALTLLFALPQEAVPLLPMRYGRVLGTAAVLALIGMIHPVGEPSAREAKRVLTYNIHQGYDVAGVPSMQSIADEIERIDADVVVLQEVGRGWDLMGGVDLIAYLEFRFPQYNIDYMPFNGQLLGLAFMSRVPLEGERRARVFTAPASAFQYGYDSWSIPINKKMVRLVGVHLTAGLEGNGTDARIDQMNQLIRAFAQDSNVLIVGDFNTQPQEAPVQNILRAGYHDVVADAGLGSLRTWPALHPFERDDYVFLKADVKPTRVAILQSLASDHLPVVAEFR